MVIRPGMKARLSVAFVCFICFILSVVLAVQAQRDNKLSDFSICTIGSYATNVIDIPSGAYTSLAQPTRPNPDCEKWWNKIRWSAGLGGLAAFMLLYLLITIASGKAQLLGLVIGADQKLSVSQLQFVTWTFVLIFVLPFLYVARMLVESQAFHLIMAFPPPPPNVLIAVGLGAFTAVAATGIATSQAASGNNLSPAAVPWPSQPPADAQSPVGVSIPLRFSDLVTNASGLPDFTKLQMLGWTVVAAGLYLGNVFLTARGFAVAAPSLKVAFPDIPDALMWLMGFSQAAYLGNKYLSGPPQTTLSP
jgi:hypothetical protein